MDKLQEKEAAYCPACGAKLEGDEVKGGETC